MDEGGAGQPIAYTALPTGVPVLSAAGTPFGSVAHVLAEPELDLFDGIVVKTTAGLRFVDASAVGSITTTAVRTTLDDAAAAALPPPEGGDQVFDVDLDRVEGSSLTDRLGRLFHRSPWTREKD